jgi:hypothetical protein
MLLGTLKNPVESVIVCRGYRVEFMVMTSGAPDGECLGCSNDGVEFVINNVLRIPQEPASESDKSHGGQIEIIPDILGINRRRTPLGRGIYGYAQNLIRCELKFQEPVVWEIPV